MNEEVLIIEAVYMSETSFYFNKTTRHYIPEGCQLHTCRCENVNPHRTERMTAQLAAVTYVKALTLKNCAIYFFHFC
jgi:hypothetical protein